jgi:hypothetical protein
VTCNRMMPVEAQGGSSSSVRQWQLWCGKAGSGAARVPGSGVAMGAGKQNRGQLRRGGSSGWQLRHGGSSEQHRGMDSGVRHGGDDDGRREGAAATATTEEKVRQRWQWLKRMRLQ